MRDMHRQNCPPNAWLVDLPLWHVTEFSPVCDSHDLLPLDVTSTNADSVPDLVAAIADGSLEPKLEDAREVA